MVFIKTVQLPARTGYVGGPTEAFVEVVWGDPISRKQYAGLDERSAIESVAQDGFKTALEFVITVPKSISVVSEVFGHSTLRDAVTTEAHVLGHSLLRKARLRGGPDSRLTDAKTRFVMFCHRTTDQNDGPPLPHLNVHLLAFAAVSKGKSYRLSSFDLRPVFERHETFHSQFLCGLAARLQKQGYVLDLTSAGFELAGVTKDLLDDFCASSPQNQEGSARHRWKPGDIQDFWQDKLGTRRLTLPQRPPTPVPKAPANMAGAPGLEQSLDSAFNDKVLIPAPSFLSALFRCCIGVCRPFQALRWLHMRRSPPGGKPQDGKPFRTILLNGQTMLCRSSDYEELGETMRVSRNQDGGTKGWVSLSAAGSKPCNWALMDKLILLRNSVLGIVMPRGAAGTGWRDEFRKVLESQNGVAMFAANETWRSRKAQFKHRLWGRWTDLEAVATKRPSGLPDVIWVLDADEISQRSVLGVSPLLLKAGKKLVFDASGPAADSQIAVLVTALSGKVWRQAQLCPESLIAEQKEITSTTGIQFATAPSEDIEARYEALFRQDKETTLVCADASEAAWYTKRIRSRLFADRVNVGTGQYDLLQLRDLAWDESRKRAQDSYQVGQWIRFRRPIKRFRPTERLRVLGQRDGQVIVEKWGSLEAALPLNYPADLEVYDAQFKPVRLGELLRVSRFNRTQLGTRFEAGELVVLSSGRQRRFKPPKGASPQEWLHTTNDKWLPVDFGLRTYGYCTTPDAPPLSVRNVIVLPSALPAFEPSDWLPRIKAGGTMIAAGVTHARLVAQLGLRPSPRCSPGKKRKLVEDLPGMMKSLTEPDKIEPVPARVRLPKDWQKSFPTKSPAVPPPPTAAIHPQTTSGLRDLL